MSSINQKNLNYEIETCSERLAPDPIPFYKSKESQL